MVVETKEILDKHHVARYCSGSRHVDGEVLPKAFILRLGETHLSVNWLEYFGLDSLDDALARVCEDKRKQGFTLRRTGRFALLRAGDVRAARIDMGALSGTAHCLTVTHIPQEGDESHSGIGGYVADEMSRIATDLLAEKVNAVSYGLRPPPMTS